MIYWDHVVLNPPCHSFQGAGDDIDKITGSNHLYSQQIRSIGRR